MREVTPLGAWLRGLAAGAVGAGVQNLYFRASSRLTPKTPPNVFQPVEPEQASEMAVQTVARRFAHGLLRRGPLTDKQKDLGGEMVHYGFGAMWGGLWGLSRESFPVLDRPLGMVSFSTTVWMLGDNLMLPAFKLAAWPQSYPVKTHVYAWLAHLAYGLGVWASYEAMRQPIVALFGTGLWGAFRARRGARRVLPKAMRPAARKIYDVAVIKGLRPVARAAAALS